MSVSIFNCPSCGVPLPPKTQSDQLVTCPACGSTLLISNWRIGETTNSLVVATPTRLYTVTNLLAKDDLCNVYQCLYKADGKEWQGMFRIARESQDNDLVQNEAQTLYHFQSTDDYDDFRAFLPLVLESFIYQDAMTFRSRQVNILSLHDQIGSPGQLYSLEEVRKYYGNGVHPMDMAWMWRRLLNILGFAHDNGVIHGGVLPSAVLIEPKDHKLALTGWSFAVRSTGDDRGKPKALSLSYESWYPPEVQTKVPLTPSLDFYMAARCALYLIGADPLDDGTYPTLDKPLQQYFGRCLHPDIGRRPQDAWQLLAEFDKIIEDLWGPRQFRMFAMPAKA